MTRLPIAKERIDEYSSHPKVKSCGAVVFHKFGSEIKYIIIKTHEKFGDNWDFPKGNNEDGESETDTANREIHEEVGLNVKLIDNFREEVHYLVKNGQILKTTVYFLGESTGIHVKLDPREVEAYEWLNYDKALEKLTYEQSKEVLKNANEFLKDY